MHYKNNSIQFFLFSISQRNDQIPPFAVFGKQSELNFHRHRKVEKVIVEESVRENNCALWPQTVQHLKKSKIDFVMLLISTILPHNIISWMIYLRLRSLWTLK